MGSKALIRVMFCVIVVAVGLATASYAALLGIIPGYPLLVYDAVGTTTYQAADGWFVVVHGEILATR